MTTGDASAFRLGRAQVERLLPHRPPLLLIDGVSAFGVSPPSVRTWLRLMPDEPVLAGHFPGRPTWPGVYTVEALAQSCALAGTLAGLDDAERRALQDDPDPGAQEASEGSEASGVATQDLPDVATRAIPDVATSAVSPGSSEPADADELTAPTSATASLPLLASIDVKLSSPVHPGETLECFARLTHRLEGLQRFEVEATAGRRLVARGRLTLALGGPNGPQHDGPTGPQHDTPSRGDGEAARGGDR